jgi:indolepyruvate ferredoxin oxidoreductase
MNQMSTSARFAPTEVSLEDRYLKSDGTILLSGTQALVRALLMQRERDRRDGLNTAGFVSGYRGSPLGGFDSELWRNRDLLTAAQVRFQPGVNEDLAATSVWGTQQLQNYQGPCVDGVFGLWYGKGPGVDRSGDVFKHANYAGTMRYGGVLVVFGDDHPGKSSTVAHQSEQALAANLIPVLYPSNVQEILDYALHGWALSRHSGLWVGLKTVNETVETTATVEAHELNLQISMPNADTDLEAIRPQADYAPQRDESVVIRDRLPRVQEYARINRLDARMIGQRGARLGLVTAGKTWGDLCEALMLLGIDEARAEVLGISVWKAGLIWPMEPEGLRDFAIGCDELLFVEEKRAFLEEQAARILFHEPSRPRITGKANPEGHLLLPSDVQLNGLVIARALAGRLVALGLADAATMEKIRLLDVAPPLDPLDSKLRRLPYFCSGCPHNTSTRLPKGATGLAGIGCHSMAMWMDRGTQKPVQMGGEGANWIGAAPFTETVHVFQNMGDGTFSHSGLLAIRAAVLSGVNITYKILANDAVAMTGGQPVEGALDTDTIVRQVLAENVARVVVVTDDPNRTQVSVPQVPILARAELPQIQSDLAKVSGTTVIVYEQVCAAEKRRRRKRGRMSEPSQRPVINPAVCEGCGDCSLQSNCVSILPLETAMGLKRRIDQSNCNKDFSCIEGFCPSFVMLDGAKPRRSSQSIDPEQLAALPLRDPAVPADCDILITGVGGTGVVTIGSVLAMAAHLVGQRAATYNMTGLAQKGGAVYSHLRLMSGGRQAISPLVGPGQADLLLGCDLVTAATADALTACATGRTNAVLDIAPMPTAAFQSQRDFRLDPLAMSERVGQAVSQSSGLPAGDISERLLGDRIGANMMLVGYAYQQGWLPLPLDAICKALILNGAAVEFNLNALNLGRLASHNPKAIDQLMGVSEPRTISLDLDQLIVQRSAHLTAYQNKALAQRFRTTIDALRETEARTCDGASEVTRAATIALSRVMSYKDEYEVARLYSTDDWRRMIAQEFQDIRGMKLLLAPPLLSRVDPTTGRPKKRAFGSWIFPVLRGMAQLKGLRGTPFDLFGHTAERRAERALAQEVEMTIRRMAQQLDQKNRDIWLAYLTAVSEIRGFGPVKEAAMAAFQSKATDLTNQLEQKSQT